MKSESWVTGQVTYNGCCGYHALAEVFVRILFAQPELINEALFDEQKTVFKPFQDFLKIKLQIQEPSLNMHNMRAALEKNRYQGQYILSNIAPALLLIALSHYRDVGDDFIKWFKYYYAKYCKNIDPAQYYTKQDKALKTAFKKIICQGYPTLPADAAQAQKEAYKQKIFMSASGDIEVALMRAFACKDDFLSSFMQQNKGSGINAAQADLFSDMLSTGLSYTYYLDVGSAHQLISMIFKPSEIVQENNHDHIIYPCAIFDEYTKDSDIYPSQHYLIERLPRQAHFTYSFSRHAQREWGEQVSVPPRYFSGANILLKNEKYSHHNINQAAPSLQNIIQEIKKLSEINLQKEQFFQKNNPGFSIFDPESLLALGLALGLLTVIGGLSIFILFILMNTCYFAFDLALCYFLMEPCWISIGLIAGSIFLSTCCVFAYDYFQKSLFNINISALAPYQGPNASCNKKSNSVISRASTENEIDLGSATIADNLIKDESIFLPLDCTITRTEIDAILIQNKSVSSPLDCTITRTEIEPRIPRKRTLTF